MCTDSFLSITSLLAGETLSHSKHIWQFPIPLLYGWKTGLLCDSFAVGLAFDIFQFFFFFKKKKCVLHKPSWFLSSEVLHFCCVGFLSSSVHIFVVFVRYPIFQSSSEAVWCALFGSLLMSVVLIWIPTHVLHPLQPNVDVQMWWQEARHPSVRETDVFSSAWRCHVQCPRCSLCRFARHVIHHNASDSSSTCSWKSWARQSGMGCFFWRRW